MKAIVKYDRVDKAVEIGDVPAPVIGPDQVLLEVKAVGAWQRRTHVARDQSLGHQAAAGARPRIRRRHCGGGRNVTGWQVGDRVACETAAEVCGTCSYRVSGNYNLCPHRLGYGAPIDGSMTQYVAARPAILHRARPCAAGVRCAHRAGLRGHERTGGEDHHQTGRHDRDPGPGPIGIMALQVAKIQGAGPIIVTGTDMDEHRLEVAAQLGA
ncbi:MAG: alcohol dehydrogenase catalytic domain-containing protein [Caldilineaceae bacterium]